MNARFVRLAEVQRAPVNFYLDGQAVSALHGDTLLVAILSVARSLRSSEFDDGRRAGFCLMGACQDCWVWTEQGERLRACSTEVSDGLRVVTRNTEAAWLNAV
jgi:predicted molibdopterin-dependent oxidoreductase YjgC